MELVVRLRGGWEDWLFRHPSCRAKEGVGLQQAQAGALRPEAAWEGSQPRRQRKAGLGGVAQVVARRVEPWYSWISELIPGLVSFVIFNLEAAKGHPYLSVIPFA